MKVASILLAATVSRLATNVWGFDPCLLDCVKDKSECRRAPGCNTQSCVNTCKDEYNACKARCFCDGYDENTCPWGSCPVPTETSTCIVDLGNGDVSCTNGNPMTLNRINSRGPVYTLAMAEWTAASVQFGVENLIDSSNSNWLMNIGNSPTNNGQAGDGRTTSNDSEIQFTGTSVAVWANDYGGSGELARDTSAVNADGDLVTAIICDGVFSWGSSISSSSISSPFIFQIDGDEPDADRGGPNDTNLHLAVHQTVSFTSSRVGEGVTSLVVTFGR